MDPQREDDSNISGNLSRDTTPSTPKRKVLIDEEKLNAISEIMSNSKILIWHYYVITEFERKCKYNNMTPKQKTKITNSINIMFMNVANGADLYKCIYESISFILKNSPFDENTLQDIIFPRNVCKETVDIPGREIIIKIMGGCVSFTILCGNGMKIKLMLTASKYYFLMGKENKSHLADLIERYYSFGFKGLFWSLHPEIFRAFEKDGTNFLNIEGFASPFNNNLQKYCSLYPADKKYGSIGNFFIIIENYELPSVKSPNMSSPKALAYTEDYYDECFDDDEFDERGVRWIINPPYTSIVLTMVYEAVKRRRQEHPEDEFVLMLPNWDYLKLYKYAVEEGEMLHFDASKYRMYDHMTQETLLLPVDMCLAVIYPKGKEGRSGWNGSTLDIIKENMLVE